MEPSSSCTSTDWLFPSLTHRDRHWLNRPVSGQEIHDAVFQMGELKAPGPDGFSPGFFQRYWHILGGTVIDAVQGMFVTGRLLPGINDSLICLIPKGAAPDRLNQCRPIALCNVLVKIVSKFLANRLRPLMAKLTGPFQASFIPGRSTVDNVIVAQEVVHSLQRRKGCKGGFVLKVDLEKAYDRVQWSFCGKSWGSLVSSPSLSISFLIALPRPISRCVGMGNVSLRFARHAVFVKGIHCPHIYSFCAWKCLAIGSRRRFSVRSGLRSVVTVPVPLYRMSSLPMIYYYLAKLRSPRLV